MEKKMEEKNGKKMLEIKEKFEDFSVEIIKASGKIKQADDTVLSEKVRESLENSLKLLTRSTYEELNEKECEGILEELDKELAVLGAFLDLAQGSKYISKEEYETCSKFIKEFENLIEEK